MVSLKPHQLSQEVSANIIHFQYRETEARGGGGGGEITFQEHIVRKGQSQVAVVAKTPQLRG